MKYVKLKELMKFEDLYKEILVCDITCEFVRAYVFERVFLS